MKLSNETIEILKNFATINPSLMVRKGNILRTVTANKTVMASATLKETFPTEFGIHDLTRLIMVLSAYDNPTIDFESGYIKISDGPSDTKYHHSAAETVTQPPSKDVELPDIDANFTITNQALVKVIRLSNGLGLPNIVLHGNGGKSYLTGTNVLEEGADSTSYEVGTADKNYRAVFDVEHMKMLFRDYNVKVSAGVAYFESTQGDVRYWVACLTPKK